MLKRNRIAACLLAALSYAAAAGADEFHYNNILIGDRASGMGGAYVAASDDPSGMYYNPAGIAYSTGKNLSASVNAYNVSTRTYENVIGGSDWDRESSYLLPNFFGIIQPVGKLKLGFSYAVPDSNQEDQDQSFNGDTRVINFNNKNDTNLFGPSAALQLSDNLSVGITLYAHKRNTELIYNRSWSDGTDHTWENDYVETNEWGIRPIFGAVWTPADKISLGLAVSKTYVLSSEVLTQSNTSANIGGVATFSRSNAAMDTSSAKRTYPYQVSGGFAYYPNSSLMITGDVSYFSPHSYTLTSYVDMKSVVNGALGIEYYLSKSWAVRGGVFTDFANTPELVSSGPAYLRGQLEHIDLYGGSLSVSHFSRNTSISLGGSYKYGTGLSQLLVPPEPLQDVTASSWTMFVSSSYSY